MAVAFLSVSAVRTQPMQILWILHVNYLSMLLRGTTNSRVSSRGGGGAGEASSPDGSTSLPKLLNFPTKALHYTSQNAQLLPLKVSVIPVTFSTLHTLYKSAVCPPPLLKFSPKQCGFCPPPPPCSNSLPSKNSLMKL